MWLREAGNQNTDSVVHEQLLYQLIYSFTQLIVFVNKPNDKNIPPCMLTVIKTAQKWFYCIYKLQN